MNYIFASYAHNDIRAVEPVLKALTDEFDRRRLAVSVWFNPDELLPGEDWTEAITRALRECIGLLVFISPSSLNSSRIGEELRAAIDRPESLIIPIILEAVPVSAIPPELAKRQVFNLSSGAARIGEGALRRAVVQIVDAIADYLERDTGSQLVATSVAPALAATIAGETREAQQKVLTDGTPNSVFVAHGHDTKPLDEVNAYLTSLGIKPVVLAKIAGPAQSLFQKFLKSSADARFAIVILTPDDRGASRAQFDAEGVGERALQFRARQNVILELGFFYGQLGWENVFVVYHSKELFPNFERPSDLDGIVFVEMDAGGQWQEVLTEKLVAAGFQIAKPD